MPAICRGIKMKNKENIQQITKLALCGLCLVLTGCGAASLAQESTFESAYENTAEEEPVNIYTSSASVVVAAIHEDVQSLSLLVTERNEALDLSYDGATVVQDKYGSPMSMAQLKEGDIAKITYNQELERLGSITLSGDAWSYEGIARYSLNQGNGSVSIGEETYGMGSNILAFSEGHPIDIGQIIHQDVLTFNGMGNKVMSITVEQGHGYLDLVNDEALLGGWIEVGQALISQIAPDMLLTIPEGDYTVRLSSDTINETRDITIERDKVTSLDLGDIEIPAPENGVVIFEVTPETAKVSVDNESVNSTYPVRLSLGLHIVTAEASGYDSLSQYIQVDGEESLTVKMDLEEQTTVSENSLSSSSENSKAQITIEAPEGADVYQDNLYMGIAPVTYTKTPGDHTITLRKAGYITRSHNIVVADDGRDATYSFPELDPEGTYGQDTVSGNFLDNNPADKNSQNRKSEGNDSVSDNSVSDNSLTDNSKEDAEGENAEENEG